MKKVSLFHTDVTSWEAQFTTKNGNHVSQVDPLRIIKTSFEPPMFTICRNMNATLSEFPQDVMM